LLARALQVRQSREKILRILGPDETLRMLTYFEIADGKQELEQPPPPPDERSGLRKAGETALGVAGLLITGPNSPSLSKMTGGISASGHIGSWAHRLAEANRTAGAEPALLVTDRRLTLAGHEGYADKRVFSSALDIPLGAIAGSARMSRPLIRGRVVIAFADGSLIALKLSRLLTTRADELARILSSPGTLPAP
jgi:hypothetical protein